MEILLSTCELKKLSGATKSTRLTIDLQNTPQVNKLLAFLPQTPGVKNLSKKLRKKKLVLKNVLLSTLEFKNALKCSGD
jgi:hypothetical protein